jgi:hypothetical protein
MTISAPLKEGISWWDEGKSQTVGVKLVTLCLKYLWGCIIIIKLWSRSISCHQKARNQNRYTMDFHSTRSFILYMDTYSRYGIPSDMFRQTIMCLNKSQMWIKSLDACFYKHWWWWGVSPFTVQDKDFTLGTTYLCFLLIMIQTTHMPVSAGQTETCSFRHNSCSTNCHEPMPMLLYFHRWKR